MKYIILFFAFINFSYATECGHKTTEEVNVCIVNDLIRTFVDYESCNWSEGIKRKDRTFENLVCDPVVPLSFFEGKLQEWKDLQNAKIAEIVRRKDVKDRLKAIGIKFNSHSNTKGLRVYMAKCGYSHSNTAVWIKEVFKAENISMLECLESKKAEVDQDAIDRQTAKANLKNLKNNLLNHDCNSESSEYVKRLCKLNKRIGI